MVRLAEAGLVCFPTDIGCECPRTFAHRACCASAILRREAEDTIRIGLPDWLDTAEPFADDPFKDSIPEIIWFNFSNRNCVALRSLRSS